MKKIRIVFTMLAILTATAGVFASEILFADTFWRNDTCTTSYSSPCTVGSNTNCVITGVGQIYYKINGTGDCLELEKP